MAEKKWFEVTIRESYTATYKVFALDQQEADDIANEAVNNGDIDPTSDGSDSYDRDTYVEEGKEPVDGDLVIKNQED